MPDYVKKAQVISSGLLKQYKQVKRAVYAEQVKYYTGEKIVANMDYDTAVEQRFFYSQFMPDEWRECERVATSDYHRMTRLKKRVAKYLNRGPCVFVTLTFRDDVLAKTSASTRRRYVHYWFKSQGECYVANIDFGARNGREHYHGLVQADKCVPNSWEYGATRFEKVRETSDSVKIAKYIAKLTNHAIKATTKRCTLIYSRDVD